MKKSIKKAAMYVVVSSIVISATVAFAKSGEIKESDVTWKDVAVHQGDTMWNLVEQENAHGDIRQLVYIANQKNGSGLKANSVIEVPVLKN